MNHKLFVDGMSILLRNWILNVPERARELWDDSHIGFQGIFSFEDFEENSTNEVKDDLSPVYRYIFKDCWWELPLILSEDPSAKGFEEKVSISLMQYILAGYWLRTIGHHDPSIVDNFISNPNGSDVGDVEDPGYGLGIKGDMHISDVPVSYVLLSARFVLI